MKICEADFSEKIKKSWGLKLVQVEEDGIYLCACDVLTGELIANLLLFCNSGAVGTCLGAQNYLDQAGYDSDEHKNMFDLSGALTINEPKQ